LLCDAAELAVRRVDVLRISTHQTAVKHFIAQHLKKGAGIADNIADMIADKTAYTGKLAQTHGQLRARSSCAAKCGLVGAIVGAVVGYVVGYARARDDSAKLAEMRGSWRLSPLSAMVYGLATVSC
jgi:hypothetical protein